MILSLRSQAALKALVQARHRAKTVPKGEGGVGVLEAGAGKTRPGGMGDLQGDTSSSGTLEGGGHSGGLEGGGHSGGLEGVGHSRDLEGVGRSGGLKGAGRTGWQTTGLALRAIPAIWLPPKKYLGLVRELIWRLAWTGWAAGSGGRAAGSGGRAAGSGGRAACSGVCLIVSVC
ncbi:hypothetical protein E1301_Tti020095 [Triplophysa tibetana]|uniref:Uncharacterized protein n=1 Tax=Triplophysa tibetana TaxID=1572043 RepID=A0A5A9P4V1_9TELE|nr:hypothetical protein E1301_Tti020095 [Triplophysa tibetana]